MASEHSESKRSRAAWMGDQGKDMYTAWTSELLDACDTDQFWNVHQQYVDFAARQHSQPTIDDIIPAATDKPYLLSTEVDNYYEISDRILSPHIDDIIRYTGAGDFLKDGRTKEQAVQAHAHDSLSFALRLSAGLAHDIALDEIPRPTPENPAEPLDAARIRQRLTLAANFLCARSFAECADVLAIAGFGTISVLATHPIDQGPQSRYTGKQNRALKFGIVTDREEPPASAMQYDQVTGTFSLRPGVRDFLTRALREQNRQGLDEFAQVAAGEAADAEGPYSRGCPVAKTGAMAIAAQFTAKSIRKSGHIDQ